MKRILVNVAMDFPDLGYYQGMNYLVIFIYETFKDETTTYRFLHFMADKFLNAKLEKSFKGVMEMIFLSDKLMQIEIPKIWEKLKSAKVSSIHFSIALLITIFSSLIKDPNMFGLVYRIWDLFLVDGFLVVLKALLQVFKIQQKELTAVAQEDLLVSLKELERNPFCVAMFAGAPPERI